MENFNNILSNHFLSNFPRIFNYLNDIQSVQTIAGEIGYYKDIVHIPDEIKKELSKEEINSINIALADNNEYYSVAGLTMLYMMMKKCVNEEEFKSFIERNKSGNALSVVVTINDERAIQNFSSWTKDDYLKAIDISRIIKEGLLKTFLDFFENPDRYKDKGLPAYTRITGYSEMDIGLSRELSVRRRIEDIILKMLEDKIR